MSDIVIIILVGIPCSGKSTWVDEWKDILSNTYDAPVIVISRDDIRLTLSGGKYTFDQSIENRVTDIFYKQLSGAVTLDKAVIILDNTHCRQAYINKYYDMFDHMLGEHQMKIYIQVFDVPYWKCLMRNWKRGLVTGKVIPLTVMEGMNENFKKLDLTKYKQFIHGKDMA